MLERLNAGLKKKKGEGQLEEGNAVAMTHFRKIAPLGEGYPQRIALQEKGKRKEVRRKQKNRRGRGGGGGAGIIKRPRRGRIHEGDLSAEVGKTSNR